MEKAGKENGFRVGEHCEVGRNKVDKK